MENCLPEQEASTSIPLGRHPHIRSFDCSSPKTKSDSNAREQRRPEAVTQLTLVLGGLIDSLGDRGLGLSARELDDRNPFSFIRDYVENVLTISVTS